MIVIKARLGTSTVSGIGLFADQDIEKGEVIGINADDLAIVRYSEDQWQNLRDQLSLESFRQIKMRSYKSRDDGLYWRNLDDTCFINHSKKPNIATKGDVDVALCDIKKGEEILIDYTSFYDEEYFKEIISLGGS